MLTFNQWIAAVEADADRTTHGIFNYRNIPFNWVERFQDGQSVAAASAALVILSIKSALAIEEQETVP